jgi:hypothetical protein
VVLHPEFVDGKYAFYTRPQDDFIQAGKGGGIGWGLSKSIEKAVIDNEIIVDNREYHTIQEVKNGMGPAPIKTEQGWLHLAHGVRNTAAGLRYVLYMFMAELDRPWVITHKPAGYFIARKAGARGRRLQRRLQQWLDLGVQGRSLHLLRLIGHPASCGHQQREPARGLRTAHSRRSFAEQGLRRAKVRADREEFEGDEVEQEGRCNKESEARKSKEEIAPRGPRGQRHLYELAPLGTSPTSGQAEFDRAAAFCPAVSADP